jgi:uncharacterized membrane protein
MKRWVTGARALGGSRQLVSAGVLAVVLVVVGLAQTAVGRRTTRSLGLSAPRQAFTELYFDTPQRDATYVQSPQPAGSGRTPVFVIQNDEHRSMGYRWTVSVGGQVRLTGTADVGAGRLDTVSPAVVVRCPAAPRSRRGKRSAAHISGTVIPVAVSLAEPPLSIRYLVDCSG